MREVVDPRRIAAQNLRKPFIQADGSVKIQYPLQPAAVQGFSKRELLMKILPKRSANLRALFGFVRFAFELNGFSGFRSGRFAGFA